MKAPLELENKKENEKKKGERHKENWRSEEEEEMEREKEEEGKNGLPLRQKGKKKEGMKQEESREGKKKESGEPILTVFMQFRFIFLMGILVKLCTIDRRVTAGPNDPV